MANQIKPCPFCKSGDTIRLSDFSTSLMVSLYYCETCKTTFEAIKWGDTSTTLDLPEFLTDPSSRSYPH
jgi:transposase-like protein